MAYMACGFIDSPAMKFATDFFQVAIHQILPPMGRCVSDLIRIRIRSAKKIAIGLTNVCDGQLPI